MKFAILGFLLSIAVSASAATRHTYVLELKNGLGAPISGQRVFLFEERKTDKQLPPSDSFLAYRHKGGKTNENGIGEVSFKLNDKSIRDRFACVEMNKALYCGNLVPNSGYPDSFCMTLNLSLKDRLLETPRSAFYCDSKEEQFSCRFGFHSKTTEGNEETMNLAAVCNPKG
ncbi:MAG: hypothetical protein IT289_12005 [Oligoflexia bacterium]|nr:hypothetical protein [Oligoflexia bacterium]